MPARVAACGMLGMLLFTAFRFIRQRDATPPLVLLVVTQFYVMFGFAQFTQEALWLFNTWYVPQPSSVELAAFIALLADASFLLGITIGRRFAARPAVLISRIYPTPQTRWQFPLRVYAIVTMIEALVINLRPDLVPIEIRNIFSMVLNPYVAFALVLYMSHTTGYRSWRLLSYSMFGLLVIAGLISAQLESVIVPVYLYVIARWIWTSRLQVTWVALALVFFILFSPVKHRYRKVVYRADSISGVSSAVDRLKLWGEAFQATWSNPFAREETIESASSRASSVMALAQAVEWVPGFVPYKHGAGFSTTLLFFIPRIMWPNKPSISDLVNNNYALTFHLASEETLQTSTIGIVQPIDGYWDFGWFGSVAYPALFGAMLGALFLPARARRSNVQLLLELVFSASFFQALSSFQNILASIFTLFVGAWIALRVIDSLARNANPSIREGRSAVRTSPANL